MTDRIQRFVQRWQGTKYMAGMRARGSGVDCVSLVCAFLDECLERPFGATKVQRISPDTGLHDRIASMKTVLEIRRQHPSLRPVADGDFETGLEPGDLLICRGTMASEGPDNPGHAMIFLGYDPCMVFHATHEAGAQVTSLASVPEIIAVYRLESPPWV